MAAGRFHFFSYVSRLKLIDRWSLMRCVQRENVQEHSHQVAVVAHALAVIKNKYFGGQVNADRICAMALYHDATEVITGDLPTPVKYFNPQIREAYQELEGHAADQLLKLLPQDLQPDFAPLVHSDQADPETRQILKSADTLCAYLKCLEERAAGNSEFRKAEKALFEKLEQARKYPEVNYFIEQFVPSFTLTLDEMSEGSLVGTDSVK